MAVAASVVLATIDADRVISSAYSHNGVTELKIWDVNKANCTRTFGNFFVDIKALAVLPQKTLVAVAVGNSVELWSLDDAERTRVLRGHTDLVSDVAVVDALRVATASWDKTACVFCVNTGACLQAFAAACELNAVVAFQRFPSIVVCAGEDGHMNVFTISRPHAHSTECWHLRFLAHKSEVLCLVALPPRCTYIDSVVVSSGMDYSLAVWNVRSGEMMRRLDSPTYFCKMAVFDTRRVVTCASSIIDPAANCAPAVWQLCDCHPDDHLWQPQRQPFQIRALAITAVDEDRAVIADDNGNLLMVTLANPRRRMAASAMHRHWRDAISNPTRKLCRKWLERELAL